ncbi:unnamed protein product [Clonostachys solani]|uniref:Uncharacterized protein n=1 Tax=Clonostachys solani TaxID=160281 RepID=A0A9N9ZHP7_9HYPO|nr:unnamed protein product [Clonostachys solani]
MAFAPHATAAAIRASRSATGVGSPIAKWRLADGFLGWTGGEYGNALQAALEGGHHEIVKLLWDKGAGVNAKDIYSNAL